MTEDTDFESADSGAAEGQDSAVVQELRKQVRNLKAELEDAREQTATAVTEAVSHVKREVKAQEVVNALGYPKLAGLVVEKIEGDLTAEAVAAFLNEELGLDAKSGGEAGTQEPASDAKGVEEVANLGQRVASAASGSANQSVEARLAAAQTPQEIAQIAREAGFLQT